MVGCVDVCGAGGSDGSAACLALQRVWFGMSKSPTPRVPMGSLEIVTSFSSGTGLGIETVSSLGVECGGELVSLLFGDNVGAREFEWEDIKAGQHSTATTR
jgi:hypothetical protein